ncbi:citrate synthase [Anaerorhabdus furcosa]|uniref:citrate synthase (unknown stereospecificity) n=1 Tax=Anaerorhabdus furcosa TaxID=118967 RepID=A0A1T4PVB8_9FIRM|nr:citrate synthase [Anaerorhabdus furcosa]SJZ95500.1 citrate synthase [Anaerorhabdus furcosa]
MDKKILEIFDKSIVDNDISHDLYSTYNVKKGLRNEDGTGVLIGLTRIADVVGYQKLENGTKIDAEGELYYRGIELADLLKQVESEQVDGFERTCFLILFGYLPNKAELDLFKHELQQGYELPKDFLTTNILKRPSNSIMNELQKDLLNLYNEDEKADDTSVTNTLKQGLSIIAKLPEMMIYSYQAKAHFIDNKSLMIHPVNKDYGIAENILHLLRPDSHFTKEEAKILDLLLIMHADHGSGNNSTFSNLVVASTGTDIYSAFSASIGSLKGPRHGGANITCKQMMDTIIAEIGEDASDDEINTIITRLHQKDFFDKQGLIYGFGHAVYTLSDPRCILLKDQARELALACGETKRLAFYERFEELVVSYFKVNKGKNICANVDFYSGLIYDMLQIPEDLYSPLFVTSRSVGWLAHNIEEKLYCNRIIRPAGLYVGKKKERIK